MSEAALHGAAYLSDTRIWSPELKVASRRWLQNFTDDEQDYAGALLESFVFLSSQTTDRLFTAAFDRLATEVTAGGSDYASKKEEWQRFRDTVFITHPTGEMPNTTDSGYAFDRRARQLIEIPQTHIGEPDFVLDAMVRGTAGPIVFVDDFVGSGHQFINTWKSERDVDGTQVSFESVAPTHPHRIVYCPIVCTTSGLDTIQTHCNHLDIRPTHLLAPHYSVAHPDSLIWPDHLRPGAQEFLKNASQRAGISDDRALGYEQLGLALAFEHGVPDATIPLFNWEENGWSPLVRHR